MGAISITTFSVVFVVLTFLAWRRYLWAAEKGSRGQVDTCQYSLTDVFADDHLVNAPHQEGVRWLTEVFSRSVNSWGLSSTGAGGPKSGLAVISVSTSKGGFLGGGFTDVDIELAMDINTAVYGADFDVKETLANTKGEVPEFDAIRKILTDSVHASWWEGSKPK